MGKKNKSKVPKGRAAAKQKAKKGGNGGGSWAQSSTRNGGWPQYGWSDDDDENDSMRPTFRGFAQTNNANGLKASNSARNFSLRNATVKLRHQAITFVSAGTNTPDEFLPRQEGREGQEVFVADNSTDEEEDSEEEVDDIDDGTLQTNIVVESEIKMSEHAFEQMNIQSSSRSDAAEESSKSGGGQTPLFVVDTVGDPSLASRASKGKQRATRSPSPTPSNSSEEVVVFQGRNNPSPVAKPLTRTKYKDVLTPAVDGGYEAHTTKTSTVRDESHAEQLAAVQALRSTTSTTKAITVQQSKPNPPHQSNRTANQQQNRPQQQSTPQTAIGWGAQTAKFEQEVAPNAAWAPAPTGSWWKNKRKPRPDLDLSESEKMAIDEKPRAKSKVMFLDPTPTEPKTASTPEHTSSGEGGAEEAIEALQAEVKSLRQSKRRARQASREQDEMSSKASTATSTPKRRGKRGRRRDNRQLRDSIEDGDEDDDAVEAAIADYMSNLADQQLDGAAEGVFAKTAHSSTLEPSLVVNGKEIGDDEVLPSHFDIMNDSDTSSEDIGPIGLDTDEISSNSEVDLSNLDSTELEDALEYTEQEQWEDEEDLRQRRRDRMTDEQIAKLFAKQQELGIEDDDLIIDNGEYVSMSEDMDGIGDIARARVGLANIGNFSFGRSNKHGMRRSNRRAGDFTFPDASALADTVEQYGENGFDIMDFDRPSLRPTKKGRKGTLPPELDALSDEDLKENMRSIWANDRRKKSAKKAERDELRMQGLLGTPGRIGKADLSQKYPFGMTKQQIHEELRIFLEDDNQQSRPFPPMAKNDRKELHEIAVVLKLSSKSIGSGKDRYPVLNKTSRTRYTPEILNRAIDASSKGFLGHGSKTARKLSRQSAKGAKGGFGGTGAATLKNGEVVGAGAAELGKENFGHKLMEKMGWSKGMALGRGGEGMLEPVQQKVRLGTAGLG